MMFSYLGIDIIQDNPGLKTPRWWQLLIPSCTYCLNYTKFGRFT